MDMKEIVFNEVIERGKQISYIYNFLHKAIRKKKPKYRVIIEELGKGLDEEENT